MKLVDMEGGGRKINSLSFLLLYYFLLYLNIKIFTAARNRISAIMIVTTILLYNFNNSTLALNLLQQQMALYLQHFENVRKYPSTSVVTLVISSLQQDPAGLMLAISYKMVQMPQC